MAIICPICQVRVPSGNEDQHYRCRQHRDNKLKASEKIPHIREGNMQDIVPDIIDIMDTISTILEVVAVEKDTFNRDRNLECLVQDIVDIIDTMPKSVEMFSNGCFSTSELAREANESPCITDLKKVRDDRSTGAKTVDPNFGTNEPSLYSKVATMTNAVAQQGPGIAFMGATKVSRPRKLRRIGAKGRRRLRQL